VRKTQNERFVYDAYRAYDDYSDVVMEKAAGIDPAEGEGSVRSLSTPWRDEKEKGIRTIQNSALVT